jgi:hypothetical protein
VELLYGNFLLPKFDTSSKSWKLVPNNLWQFGTYGLAGFGNMFNNYTWSAAVYNNQLFIGTMDFSYLVSDLTPTFGVTLPSQAQQLFQSRLQRSYGADLWRFTDNWHRAQLIDGNGLGNDTSYGIRNLITGQDAMWVGMANPMNLRSNYTDNPGGWKLIQFK